jgi:uncharacterized membrane protein
MESETIHEYNFYERMNEVASYTHSNKMDTIFVFQLTFISLLTFIVLYYLYKNNIITLLILTSVSILFGLFLLYIYINRIFVNSKIRDHRNWSRINFGDGQIKPANYNEAGVQGGENGSVPTQRCGPADPTTVCTAV